MKKKLYARVSILFFIVSISIFLYSLCLIGLFHKNKIMVRALACDTCANYQVVMGSFKLSGHIADTIKNKNISQVFLTGLPNPYAGDYTKTYDYYIITGTVTGLRQVHANEPWNPVITVTDWQHIYLSSAWPFILIIVILLGFSLHFHRRYINANKLSVLKSSLMANEDIPE
jgi:hypothetical protein